MNWELTVAFHLPHDRFAIGWEYVGPSEDENINTFTLYLLICTVSINVYN
jgi:hypothetical protein